MHSRWLACAFLLVLFLVAARSSALDDAPLPPAVSRKVDFVKDVQPIFASTCLSCHGPQKQRGDLRLDVRSKVKQSGVIVPGKSADSKLIHLVAGSAESKRMPPMGTLLTAEQVGILRAWIDQGAVWPDSADLRDAKHWAYQPLTQPATPAVKQKEWVRNPVDAFVLAKLEASGMQPAPAADRRLLLRRVYFDLTGLPPTPEEVEKFLADTSPDAYEKVVDRLLQSPRYGERWARHWMDAVHFAETHGHDQDAPRENAWPYRDYLIRAFNDDKPYARFVQEQIAGDVLFPGDPQALIATGFLAAGPWDESSQKDINGDTLDKKIAQYLDRDDMITTTLATFTSATIHCARCHDHKFDPISQKEYYSLQAVFAGVDRANRAYDADPKIARARQELQRQLTELDRGPAALMDKLLTPAVKEETAKWEKSLGDRRSLWTVIEPQSVTSSGGATPEKLPDHSYRFGGKRPDKDTYTVILPVTQKGLTGLRLEVLTDDKLPHHGPGRQDNGNLHLSEVRLEAAPNATPEAKKPVTLQNPRADFDQQGWTIAMAIDGKPQTAWGIYPQVGKPHQAVFEFKEPVTHDGGALLTLTLEQLHGGGHLIGRLRCAVTTSPHPLSVDLLPDALQRILATSAEQRTVTQDLELAWHVVREKVQRELGKLPAQQVVYAAASDFTPLGNFTPARGCRPVQMLKRGDIRQPQGAAEPGALSCLQGLEARFALADPQNEGQRRAALASWLTDSRNVLTWRSIVNRVWHLHFGQGIVKTLNDFGHMGARPSHPELLDWLAVWFRDNGGSLKKLHRLLVTSNAYRQSATHKAEYARRDADNLLLWRMNRQRLDAESIRDAVLQMSGKLDLTMGGPSVKQFIQTPGIHVTPNVDYQHFDVDNPAYYRRSVYRFVFRTLPDPFMDTLDCADASQLTPVRHASVTALHALAMLNDRFLVRQCEHLAARIEREAKTPAEQIDRLYQLALGRAVTGWERERLTAYAKKHGLANACRVVINSNEFMFVE
jgi:mono/diheme cytochrome c family protein